MRKNAILLGAVLLWLASVLSYAQTPVPFINLPLLPDATAPGGPQFTLTVNGTGFVLNSVVNWNGSALTTQFVNRSQLTAIVPAEDISTASTASVTVVNPAPGGGTSNFAFFTVAFITGDQVSFTLSSSPATGAWPRSVAVGDFNGDGKLDLAVANSGSGQGNTLSILLGDGAGSFILASSPTVGGNPMSVAVGDFNKDGKLDLVVANQYSYSVSVLLGDGAGNFTLASTPGAGNLPTSVAVGDFNGDGRLDLVVANRYGNSASILLGNGDGNFTLASTPSTDLEPESVAVGDLNGDGKLDLAVANHESGTVSVLLGDGTGNFTLASSPATGWYSISVAIADFNGDGKLDLAVSTELSNNISILLGDGTGNFTLASSPDAGIPPNESVAVGDFNGDSKVDLAVANWGSGHASILLGDNTGNFTKVSSPGAGLSPASVGVGDFNGDGTLDLATPNYYSNTVSILLGAPPTPTVVISPATLSFGTQLVGTTSRPQPVTFTNSGSVPVNISSITASANFVQRNDCGPSLAPGVLCTINVAFRPHNINTLSGPVTITDNAPNSPQTVPLTGIGTVVTLLPAILDFGNQPVGTTSQPQTATLTNHGPYPLRILGVHIKGNNPEAFAQTSTCGPSVPTGGSCILSIAFTPNGKGGKTAMVYVGDNGGGSPQTVALSGSGT